MPTEPLPICFTLRIQILNCFGFKWINVSTRQHESLGDKHISDLLNSTNQYKKTFSIS